MSTIHQYLIRDVLSESDSGFVRNESIAPEDEYAHHVVLSYTNRYVGAEYTPPLNGVAFSKMNSGYSVSNAHLLSPGGRDFCLEMFFRLSGTYSSELFDELCLINHPIFYLTPATPAIDDPGIFLYIDNDYIPNNVGLNGLTFVLVDNEGVSVIIYISPTNFLAWLNSGSQYKGITIGRRGKYFFAYLNGQLVNTVESASFGAINVPEGSICHILGVPEHNSLTNYLSGIRMTVGVSRYFGPTCAFKVGQDIPACVSTTRMFNTGGDIEECLGVDLRPKGRAISILPPLDGSFFDFRDMSSLSSGHIWETLLYCKSQIESKSLAFTYHLSTADKERGLKINDSILTWTSANYFHFFVTASILDLGATAQSLIMIQTSTYVRLQVSYDNGYINILVYSSNIYGDYLLTKYNQSFKLNYLGDNVFSFGVIRNSSGLFVTFEDKYQQISYGGGYQFTNVLDRYLLIGAEFCRIMLHYYKFTEIDFARAREILDFMVAKSFPESHIIDGRGLHFPPLFNPQVSFDFYVQNVGSSGSAIINLTESISSSFK